MSIKICIEKFNLLNHYFKLLMALGILALFLTGGCANQKNFFTVPIKGRHNNIHYLIIGLGIVTVPETENRSAVLVTKSRALGVSVSDQPGLKFGLGYSSSNVVAIPDGAEDVRVEISQKIGGPIKIDAQKALLNHQ